MSVTFNFVEVSLAPSLAQKPTGVILDGSRDGSRSLGRSAVTVRGTYDGVVTEHRKHMFSTSHTFNNAVYVSGISSDGIITFKDEVTGETVLAKFS